MKTTIAKVGICLTALIFSANLYAKVPPEEAEKLKSILTPLGAERAGSADGSIPQWTGEIPDTESDSGKRLDPFANEEPLYTIDQKNVGDYSETLSAGQVEMIRKYPEYRIDVYPTHRTAVAPEYVYEGTYENAVSAEDDQNGYAIAKATSGIPFPIPQTGTQVMWNTLLKWQGVTSHIYFNTYIVTEDGNRVMVSDSEAWSQFPYYYKNFDMSEGMNEWNLYKLITHGPSQKSGEAILVRETFDPTAGRPSWQYLTGQRRVRQLPNVAYDTPSFVTSGVSNFDEIFIWSGPLDRYNWELVGKKEMIVPYNNNGFVRVSGIDKVMKQRHLNPDHIRWEKHRVWEVKATLKEGARHVMPERVFYIDEDTWQPVLADGWDAKGQLWKTYWYLNLVASDLPGVVGSSFGHYDLQTGEWIANVMPNEKSVYMEFIDRLPESVFSPRGLATQGIR
ncbi:DUF1329 domain-containing protein [Marinobacter salarius]|uniref:DUF1329 domain-containing protein n=1 Tax=Marinobacter salarius TaxID=1420917 RepID=UPI001D188CFF|nr:DUF1329 domain-containing protein [Marinobacter salarius]MCC4284843.1 DUF1329 domain-containing protein [Marinobacter salarius]